MPADGIIDAYGHVSLPRQTTVERFLQVMDENGVEHALVSTAETCPDLWEVSRAGFQHPERMRSIGLPIGSTPQERRQRLRAQLQAGFVGVRIQARRIAAEPELLEPVGRAGGTPVLVGGDGYRVGAEAVLEFLHSYPECVVCAAHFAGPTDPTLVDRDRVVRTMYSHPRFLVVCSRHSAMDPQVLLPWAKMLVELVGWERLVFGSEWPVALWRDELYTETTRWMDRFHPSAAERQAYLHENARRHLWDRPCPRARLLEEPWARLPAEHNGTVRLFPKTTLDLPERTQQALLEDYLSRPLADRGRYSDFLAELLRCAAAN